MSIYTAEWFQVEPFFYHWDNRAACELFVDENLIKDDGFIYACAEDRRKLTDQQNNIQ